jgi:hypothetical protein
MNEGGLYIYDKESLLSPIRVVSRHLCWELIGPGRKRRTTGVPFSNLAWNY